MGDEVAYTQVTNPSPSDYLSSSNFLVNVYGFDISAGSAYYFNYLNTTVCPLAYLYRPTNYGYSYSQVSGGILNAMFYAVTSGRAYFVVINPNYFTWQQGLPISQLANYNLLVGNIPTETYDIGNVSQFSVNSEIGYQDISFTIASHMGVYFNYTALTNNYPILSVSYYIVREDSIQGLTTVTPVQTEGSMYLYDLMPGTYHMMLSSDFASDLPETIGLQSTIVTTNGIAYTGESHTTPTTYQSTMTEVSSSNANSAWSPSASLNTYTHK